MKIKYDKKLLVAVGKSRMAKGTQVIVLAKTTSSWYEVTCPDGKHARCSCQ